MTKHLGCLIGIVVACAGAPSAGGAFTFNSPEGRFHAEFPAAPTLAKAKGTARGNPYDQYRWSTETAEGWWGVSMFIYANAAAKDYDANTSGALAATKGNLVSQKPVRQSGVEGREILIDVPQSGVVRQRLFWIGDRLYLVVFAGKPGTATTPDVDAFLDSFHTIN